MNLGEIWAECGRLLNDPSNQRWTTDVLTTRANLASIEIQGSTNAVKTVGYFTPFAVNDHRLLLGDDGVMNVIRAEITRSDGSTVPFPGINREELNFNYPDWQQWPSGEPKYWIFEETSNRLFLVPTPDADNVITDGIQLWQSIKPAALSVSTDIPFDEVVTMYPYHMSIVHWVVAQCWMDNGDQDSLAKAKFHKSGMLEKPGEYEKQILRIRKEFDAPQAIPSRILWKPEGGRLGWSSFRK